MSRTAHSSRAVSAMVARGKIRRRLPSTTMVRPRMRRTGRGMSAGPTVRMRFTSILDFRTAAATLQTPRVCRFRKLADACAVCVQGRGAYANRRLPKKIPSCRSLFYSTKRIEHESMDPSSSHETSNSYSVGSVEPPTTTTVYRPG